MALTPVEIRHLSPPRTTFRGYKTAATDKLLEEIAASFEDVWRERADLADKVEQLEADLVRFRELETLLRTTLVSAEQASANTRDQARREAELILSGARSPRTSAFRTSHAGCVCSSARHSLHSTIPRRPRRSVSPRRPRNQPRTRSRRNAA